MDSKVQPKDCFTKGQKYLFIVDETQIKVGSEYIWLWIVIEPKNRTILALTISKEKNRFVAEHFLSNIVEEYRRYPVSTDGGHGTHRPAGF